MSVTAPVMANEDCRRTFWGVTERRICTLGIGGSENCLGDSDGALFSICENVDKILNCMLLIDFRLLKRIETFYK
jgi:hypothetical protein